jgi:2-phosphosulfolactate phosphatase
MPSPLSVVPDWAGAGVTSRRGDRNLKICPHVSQAGKGDRCAHRTNSFGHCVLGLAGMTSSPSIRIESLTTSAGNSKGAVVIIDVFRAFTTAAIALSNGAEAIVMVDDVASALALRDRGVGKLCIGERRGLKPNGFDFGNSPHEIRNISFSGDIVIQTTSNGTKGVVAASGASSLYAASFVNAAATVRAIQKSGEQAVWLIAAGDGQVRTEEDEICALYMRALLQGRSPDRDAIRHAVGTLSPRLDGQTLSAEDFAACLEVDAIPLAIRVEQTGDLLVARGVRVDTEFWHHQV